MAVGQQDRFNVREASSDTGQERLYAAAREPGVDQRSASAGLYICRVARASARQNTKSQVTPYRLDLLIPRRGSSEPSRS